MKKVMVLLVFLFIFPLISAEITITQQPAEIYNFGDVINVPITIRATTITAGFLNMDIICDDNELNFYKNSFYIAAGEEKLIESSLLLSENIIGQLKGTCKIRASLGSNSILSNAFKISNLIKVNSNFEKLEFSPGETFMINGEATKENGRLANGFAEISILEDDAVILNQIQPITNGFFSINFFFPEKIKAGVYSLRLNVYEKDESGKITNNGFLDKNIKIIQMPTSLEIFFENPNVEPGTNLKVKAVLYDQTGEKIFSSSSLTIRNNNQTINQVNIATDEFMELPIAKNESPSTWQITATSEKITTESSFIILEKEDVDIKIVNKTLIVTNIGNIPYNKTAIVKIGDTPLNIDVYLEVGESQKYVLTAPKGEYNVEIIAGDKSVSERVALTGRAIDIKTTPGKIGSIVKHPSVWIFILLILGFVTFIMFKRGYPKSFIAYIRSGKPKGRVEDRFLPIKEGAVVRTGNKAELSLSLKGDKQEVSVVAVNIKNLTEIESRKSNAEETIQKIINLAEENKAVTYENYNSIFFIISPLRTKTFKNEKTALNIAMKIKEILAHHNKMFHQKIMFGISITSGTIVAKQDINSFKFMSLGNLMGSAKKLSSLADEEILLDEKMNDRLGSNIKTIKSEKDKMKVYYIKEVRTENEEQKKFINRFLERNKG